MLPTVNNYKYDVKMTKMIKYKINEKFPFSNPVPYVENTRSELNSEFIDIIYNIQNSTPKDVKVWSRSNFRYGLFVESDIPFFIIDFGGWNLEVSVNLLKLTDKNQRDLWLKKRRGCLQMFLIDADTNVLKSLRIISFSSTVNFKQILEKQEQRYQNYSDVDLEIKRIYSKYSLRDMINRTKMIKLR